MNRAEDSFRVSPLGAKASAPNASRDNAKKEDCSFILDFIYFPNKLCLFLELAVKFVLFVSLVLLNNSIRRLQSICWHHFH